jgi:hypothetical protein
LKVVVQGEEDPDREGEDVYYLEVASSQVVGLLGAVLEVLEEALELATCA